MTKHQPAGIPIGGQFAPTTYAEPGVYLAAAPTVILPGSSVTYGQVVSETEHEDGSESTVRAMSPSPEFDSQLRAHLGVEYPDE
ncbi:hypothetical protein [Arthrobacter sp. PAMC25284]|uniref:hypothetical protein n=1 Tax=Arthrobacter sp. PAMC25284 TaxID=2861279 RepID=UPI001C632DAD|nr:hypothetical protein [Arthrobacter sp. PAMC25284]QYF88498.1 hypothetical protein KY499_09375 [Arthrobacter sp. PAMC25284]